MARRKWTLETIEQVQKGENPFIQVGYEPKAIKRKDGEEWTDSKGVTWKKENGGITRINKQMDAIRDSLKIKCTKCGQRLDFSGDKLDKKVMPKTGLCFDCLQVEEMHLRVHKHIWDAYEEKNMMKNKLGLLKDFKEKVIESIDFLKKDTGKIQEVMPTGELLTFTGKANPQWLIDAEADLVKVNEEIKRMEGEVSKLDEVITSK